MDIPAVGGGRGLPLVEGGACHHGGRGLALSVLTLSRPQRKSGRN